MFSLFQVYAEENEIEVISDDVSITPSPSSKNAPKRLRIDPLPNNKDNMLGAAYQRMMQEDEWDKTTSSLAEHMRNAVAEFPTLADDFRMRLLQLQVDVQKKRSDMRQEKILNFDEY